MVNINKDFNKWLTNNPKYLYVIDNNNQINSPKYVVVYTKSNNSYINFAYNQQETLNIIIDLEHNQTYYRLFTYESYQKLSMEYTHLTFFDVYSYQIKPNDFKIEFKTKFYLYLEVFLNVDIIPCSDINDDIFNYFRFKDSFKGTSHILKLNTNKNMEGDIGEMTYAKVHKLYNSHIINKNTKLHTDEINDILNKASPRIVLDNTNSYGFRRINCSNIAKMPDNTNLVEISYFYIDEIIAIETFEINSYLTFKPTRWKEFTYMIT